MKIRGREKGRKRKEKNREQDTVQMNMYIASDLNKSQGD